jgi:hypothetical protein
MVLSYVCHMSGIMLLMDLHTIYMTHISMKNPGGSTRVGKGLAWGPTAFRDCRVFFEASQLGFGGIS